MSNEFDAAVTTALQPDTAQSARVGFSAASDTNPDAYAEAKRVARRTGVPVDTVFAMPNEIKRQDAIGSIDFDTLAKTSPSTAALLADVEKAKVAHDDVDALSGFEQAYRLLSNSGRAVAAAIPQMNAGLWGAAAAPFELVGADGVGGYLRDQQKITQGMAKSWGPQGTPSGNIEAGWYSGLTSAGSNLLTLPMAFLPGGQNAALTAMVAPVFGESYGKARDKGLTPLQGINYGTQDAAAEWAGEKLGLGSLVKNVKVGSGFGKTLVDYLAREVPSEMATTLAQSFNEYANINPEKPVGEWVKQLPDEMAQTVVATLVGGGAITTTVKVADKAIQMMVGKQQEAQQAGQMSELLGRMNQYADASNLRMRDTETAQGFFQSILDEGRDAVYVSPEALAQSGLAEQMAQAIPAVAEQLGTAAEAGHDIRIPIADLMATMAGPELEQSLLPHVAVEPGGFTPTTAQEYLQSDQAKELQAEVDRVLGEKEGDDTFKASAQAVKTTVKDQLTTAGRFTESVNDAYSSMVGNFYAVQAARMGTTPEEMFKRYPLKIGAESVAGKQFDQGGGAQSPNFDDFAKRYAASKPIDIFDHKRKLADAEEEIRRDYENGGIDAMPIFNILQEENGDYFDEDGDLTDAGIKRYAELQDDAVESAARDQVGDPQQKITDFSDPGDAAQLLRDYLDAAGLSPNAVGGSGKSRSKYFEIENGKRMIRVSDHELPDRYVNDSDIEVIIPADSAEALAKIKEVAASIVEDAPPPNSASTRSSAPESGMQERPTTNSNGKPIAQTEEGLRNFWRWFGDSKVVDADGKPMVVYHSTANTFDTFVADKRSDGFGFYFATSERKAKKAASQKGVVLPVFISANNVYGSQDAPLVNWLDMRYDGKGRQLAEQGYDAVWVKDEGGASLVVRNPTQIKSVNNRETFDPNDANILNQSGRHPFAKFTRKQFLGSPKITSDSNAKDLIPSGKSLDGVDAVAFAVGDGLSAKYSETRAAVFDEKGNVIASYSFGDTLVVNKKFRRQGIGEELVYQWRMRNPEAKTAATRTKKSQALQEKVWSRIERELNQSQNGTVALNALASKGDSKAIVAQSFVDGTASGNPEQLGNILVGVSSLSQSDRLGSVPSLAPMLTHMRGAILNDAKVLDAIVRSVPVDMVNNLFGSEAAAKVALHDEAMNENSSAFNTDLMIADGVDAADPVSLLVREVAVEAAKVARGAFYPGLESKEGSAAFGANNRNSFSQGVSPRATFNPSTLTVTLLNGADLSSFLHESGHFFLEVQADLAGQLMQDAAIHGADTLKPGEQQVVKDMQATLDWFGIKDLSEWNALDFEEKRSYHEKFARGFESYLFEGKAPSIELQGLFQRFRAWMMNVYRDLKALNVELTDEVRGVFDRMVATTEQITLAEQGRSMMPLFTSPEQIGMTPAEFADYQALGTDATNEAIEDLQARGLRDMQWIHNARGRVIKQLQKESAAKRAEVKMGVRAEVMSQPIYRAWQFLTGKMTADDQIDPVTPPKSDPNVLDETIDSLFAAIAKLGGINKDDVVKTWGVDPADKPTSGLFGKPLWRVEGGLSIDGMAEALSQYGYLDKDENGKWDIRELEEKFKSELGGDAQYSNAFDYSAGKQNQDAPITNPMGLTAGRLSMGGLSEIGLPAEIIQTIKAHKMTAKGGLHPDIVAEMFGFTSGDELVRRLAAAEAPKAEIEALTDQRMLEQFGDLSSEEAIKKAADKAIHNDVRARLVATELAALEKATGKRTTLASAAKEYAAAMIARLKVRDIKPGQYAAGEVRAAKATEKASKAGDLATAAAEKRNQLINTYATRAAYDAQEEVEKGLRYLKTFDSAGKRKGLDADYTDQIDALLERFDLRKGQSGKAIDKRKALAEWLTAQQDAGLEPDIPQQLVNEAFRKSYKDMTVEELRGLIDTIKQIEHLGRLKHKLLTARDQRAYEAIRDEIAASIVEHAGERKAETRTPDTVLGKSLQKMRNFWAAHIKSAMWARIMDGGKDGGPMWEYFVRAANERGDMETTMRAEATAKLSEILDPVFKLGKMQAKVFFPLINRSLTREARIAIALNVGNASNLQRLQGGEVWTDAQLAPILRTLTAAEWQAVQQVWDHFESYRPQIAAKERRVYGKEPEWIAPTPFTVQTADGQSVQMRGGYYPVKYDPAASQRAEEHADAEGAKRQLQGAYTSATTRRSFTKTRAEEVNGRPLLYSLAGVYSGVNDVIHDLSWHEWLIDTNRLLRSQTIDSAIRNHYGPEVKQQFKKWSADIAEGDKASTDSGDIAVNYIRQSVSVAGLGFNVMSAAIQPLGITQSIVRVGAKWVGRGIAKYIAHPIELTREVNSMSSFMENRARTRFRELNELRNQVEGQTKTKEFVGHYAYFLMMRFQQAVDVPTWWGAYEKAVAEGNDDERAVSLADQAVIDSQGGGMLKDQAGIERTGATGKLFTVFYSFMNTAMNMGVAQTMTEKSKAKLVADYALLYLIPPMLGMALKAAITPGDSGDDDPEKIAKKLLAAQIDYMMGMMVYVREFSDVAKTLTGANDMGRDYQGPAGLRLVVDAGKFAKQVGQGEFDDAFRKASVNLIGDLFGLPSAQLNRTITGIKALAEGETENPAAIAFGFQKPR